MVAESRCEHDMQLFAGGGGYDSAVAGYRSAIQRHADGSVVPEGLPGFTGAAA